MHTPRVELSSEIHDDARKIADLEREFEDSLKHNGSGTRRAPVIVWQELIETTTCLCAATAEARDEAERGF
jgi:hypothetical protein